MHCIRNSHYCDVFPAGSWWQRLNTVLQTFLRDVGPDVVLCIVDGTSNVLSSNYGRRLTTVLVVRFGKPV